MVPGRLSVLIALFGVGDVIGGISVDPGITTGLSGLTLAELQAESAAGYRLYDFASRAQGLVLVIGGVLMTVILLIPYRAGMPWAWFAMWTLPAWAFGRSVLPCVRRRSAPATPAADGVRATAGRHRGWRPAARLATVLPGSEQRRAAAGGDVIDESLIIS